MSTLTVLTCPVCGAPLESESDRCAYCGSVVVIQTYHPRIDPHALNKLVIDEHIGKFRKAVRLDHNDETAHYGLGVAYFNLGLLDEAADELTQAARLMPENPHIQTQLAVVLAEVKGGSRRDEAWDRLNRALRLNPRHVDALLLKAEILANRGDVDESISTLRQADKEDPGVARARLSRALLLRARDDLMQQRYRNALATWQEVAELDPDALRPIVQHFLDAHRGLLRLSSRFSSKPSKQRGRNRGWFWKTLGLAILAAFVSLVLVIVAAVNTPAVNGDADLGHPWGILFILSTLGIFLAPIVVFVVGFMRRKTWIAPTEREARLTADELIEKKDAPISQLLDAAGAVVEELNSSMVKRSR